MIKRGIFCLLFFSLVGATSALAGNPNESTGSPTHSIMLSGPGGDSISAYNGSLELGIPIGPTWELPGLPWGLQLSYSSKVWRTQGSQPEDGKLARKGPFGVGWLMTMGRIYHPCREGCDPEDEEDFRKAAYEDPSGTVHPIRLDLPNGGSIMPGMTSDGTFMRVEAVLVTPGDPNSVDYYRLYPGNGVVMIFDDPFGDSHPNQAGLSDDFHGLLLTRMEKRGPDPNVVYSWVEVDYETLANKVHCIKGIRDGLGSSTTALRTITFTNESEHSAFGGGTAPYHGGYTTEIKIPTVVGQTSTTATYRFVYQDLKTLSWPIPGGGTYGTLTLSPFSKLTLVWARIPGPSRRKPDEIRTQAS